MKATEYMDRFTPTGPFNLEWAAALARACMALQDRDEEIEDLREQATTGAGDAGE